ncbi:MAG TPA: hypothetical protein VFO41_13570 [Alphaproteobacteria bacterium]|nr:hypothetical protein [Alphaproteobacteria bacterium]
MSFLAKRFALLALLPAALGTAPALAQSHGHPFPIMDQVVLTLSAEDWVESDTARVTVGIDAALPGSDAATVRSEMMDALGQLAPDAEWRFVRFDRGRDESGLERWNAAAEARLPETALGGLEGKADEASRPGLQVRVENTDFSPTLAETETVKAQLRSEVYARAGEELQRLNQAFPDRGYRVATIDFVNQPYHPMMDAQPAYARAAPMAAESVGSGGGFSVSEKLTVTAQVVLQTLTEWGGDEGNGGE